MKIVSIRLTNLPMLTECPNCNYLFMPSSEKQKLCPLCRYIQSLGPTSVKKPRRARAKVERPKHKRKTPEPHAYQIVRDPGGDYSPGATFSKVEFVPTLEAHGFNPGTVIRSHGREYIIVEQGGIQTIKASYPKG